MEETDKEVPEVTAAVIREVVAEVVQVADNNGTSIDFPKRKKKTIKIKKRL